jgi:hypothetical protein
VKNIIRVFSLKKQIHLISNITIIKYNASCISHKNLLSLIIQSSISMKTLLLCAVSLLFFACNSGKKDAVIQQLRDSIRLQQKQIDSLKSFMPDTPRKKAIRDSLRKIKLTYWKKQSTLMSTSLSADKAMLNKARQNRRGKSPERKKKEIKEATTQLAQDKKRAGQIHDSLRKYQN